LRLAPRSNPAAENWLQTSGRSRSPLNGCAPQSRGLPGDWPAVIRAETGSRDDRSDVAVSQPRFPGMPARPMTADHLNAIANAGRAYPCVVSGGWSCVAQWSDGHDAD